ncbi:MAG TPA: hypothetical protein PK997_07005 [Candidatus Omnitrophota bacterium]|nr:hypothetical protein [Candidatus Omnitrophota bacterium]HQB94939.1 hypothetical protein [Candidatus Omnitrophota bacterium]
MKTTNKKSCAAGKTSRATLRYISLLNPFPLERKINPEAIVKRGNHSKGGGSLRRPDRRQFAEKTFEPYKFPPVLPLRIVIKHMPVEIVREMTDTAQASRSRRVKIRMTQKNQYRHLVVKKCLEEPDESEILSGSFRDQVFPFTPEDGVDLGYRFFYCVFFYFFKHI